MSIHERWPFVQMTENLSLRELQALHTQVDVKLLLSTLIFEFNSVASKNWWKITHSDGPLIECAFRIYLSTSGMWHKISKQRKLRRSKNSARGLWLLFGLLETQSNIRKTSTSMFVTLHRGIKLSNNWLKSNNKNSNISILQTGRYYPWLFHLNRIHT